MRLMALHQELLICRYSTGYTYWLPLCCGNNITKNKIYKGSLASFTMVCVRLFQLLEHCYFSNKSIYSEEFDEIHNIVLDGISVNMAYLVQTFKYGAINKTDLKMDIILLNMCLTLGVPTKILVIFYTRVIPMKINEFYSTFNFMRWNSVVEWY